MNRFFALVLAITTGIAREQAVRRRVMLILTLAALVMLFVGSVFLWNVFVQHPLVFALYWLACGWVTVCVILLAIYDLILVFAQARKDRIAAKKRVFGDKD